MAVGTFSVFAQRPLGVDVSDYQSASLNWTDLKSGGITFAWAKATEGLTVNDANFTIYEINAKNAGVLIGAYHFAHPELHIGTAGADAEAAHFWDVASNYVKGGSVYLMPMLDVESDLTSVSPAYTKITLSQWVNEWCADIINYAASNGVTVKPVIYTYTSYAAGTSGNGPGFDGTVTQWPLWMASYPSDPDTQTGAPDSTIPWATWSVWQYTDSNSVPGAANGFDADVFNGNAAGLGALVIGGVSTPEIASQPLWHAVDTGGNTTFAASAAGTEPLSYQWTFAGTPISGATNATYTLINATTNDAGNYALIVTNAYGSATSNPAWLIVYPIQTPVFVDNFNANSATNWIVNKSSSDNSVTFSFDYSTLGIPSAPHSTNGTTLGVQMKANLSKGIVAALSISPTNQTFSGDYRLHFDAWINVNGPLPGGGGSTEFLTAGIGTSGNHAEWTGNSSADGFYFSTDGDGGVSGTSTTSGDYCAYSNSTLLATSSGVYIAGTDTTARDNANIYYYTLFPTGQPAPALQQANYPQQTGNLNTGTFGLAWHDVIVSRRGNSVDWVVDGVRLAYLPSANFTAGNVFVGFWDPFASLSSNNVINFGLIDNVRVEVPAVAPNFTTQPLAQTVPLGTDIIFTAAATGLPAPNFQWQFNGMNISGATNANYSISFVTETNAGNYSVIAENVAGANSSTNALLALIAPMAARFQTIAVQADGTLQISFTGDANTNWNYTIETSTNLTTWNVLTNLTSADGNYLFNAGPVNTSSQQFFRARTGP